MAEGKAPAVAEMSFEAALKELEQIVQRHAQPADAHLPQRHHRIVVAGLLAPELVEHAAVGNAVQLGPAMAQVDSQCAHRAGRRRQQRPVALR